MSGYKAFPGTIIVHPDNGFQFFPSGGETQIPVGMLPDLAIPDVHIVADEAARLALVSAEPPITEGEWAIQSDDESWWLFDGADFRQAPVLTPGVYALVVHTHAISDVTGLTDALSGKAAASHGHAQSDVTGLVTALSGKAATAHGHAAADIAAPTVPNGHVLTATDGVGAWAAPAGAGSARPALATYDTEADLPNLIGDVELGEMALLYRTGRIMRWSEVSMGVYAWIEYGRVAPGGPATPATSPMALDLSSSAGGWINLIVLDDTTTSVTVQDPSSALGAGGAEVIIDVINLSSVARSVVFAEGQTFWQHYNGAACDTYEAPAGSVTQLRFRLIGDTASFGCSAAVAIEPESWIRAAVPPEAPTEVPAHTHAASAVLPGTGTDGQVLTLVDGEAVWADIPGDPAPAPETLPPWIPAGSSAARATIVLEADDGGLEAIGGAGGATIILEARGYDTAPF